MQDLARLAALIQQRNAIDQEIAQLIGRPALIGHVGEYIASRLFGIDLMASASHKGIDGYFGDGPLAGRSVNIKWYAKLDGALDITPAALPDTYLVLAGPPDSALSSRGATRPWLIDAVYLFDAVALVEHLRRLGVKIGVATSVRRALWQAAQVYPEPNNPALPLSEAQRARLAQFGSSYHPIPGNPLA